MDSPPRRSRIHCRLRSASLTVRDVRLRRGTMLQRQGVSVLRDWLSNQLSDQKRVVAPEPTTQVVEQLKIERSFANTGRFRPCQGLS